MDYRYLARLATGLFILSFAGISNATLVTYEIIGTGYRMFEHNGLTGTSTTVSNSSLFGFYLENDDTFNVTFTYDTSAIESNYTQNLPEGDVAIYSSGLVNYKVNFNLVNYTFDPYGSVQIWDDRPSIDKPTDSFSVSSSEIKSSDLFVRSGFYMFDRTGQSQNGLLIPKDLDPIYTLGSNLFEFAWLDRNNGNQLHFSGNVTDLTLVPIPTTIFLFGTCLAGLLASRVKQNNNGSIRNWF